MYQKIYDVVEKRGRTRTGIILGGELMQDLNILRKKTASFIRIIKTGEKSSRRFSERKQ